MTANMKTIASTFEKFIKSRPGFDYANYGDSTSYNQDVRAAGKQRRRALAALEEFRYLDWNESAYKEAQRSFSGRLTLSLQDDGRATLDYTAGQYWCTEYRHAAAVWLETYNQAARPKPAIIDDPDLLNVFKAVNGANHDALKADKTGAALHAAERAALQASWVQDGLTSKHPDFESKFGKHYLYFGYDRMFSDWVIVPYHIDEREAVRDFMESRGMKRIDSTRFYSSLPAAVERCGAVCPSWRFHALDVEPPYEVTLP